MTGIEEAVIIGAVVAAAAGSAYGAVAQAQAQKAQAKAQYNAARFQAEAEANAAEYNRKIALQNASDLQAQTILEANQIQRETKLRLGVIRAQTGASGTSLEGSALDLFGDVVGQSELERQTALYKGQLQARGQFNEAQLFQYKQDVYRQRANMPFKYYGQSPLAAGILSGVGSLASSSGSLLSLGGGGGSSAGSSSGAIGGGSSF